MPIYTITENTPFPFQDGESDTQSFDSSVVPAIDVEVTGRNVMVDIPLYRIVQTAPTRPPRVQVQQTVINQTTIINAGENVEVAAEYFNTAPLTNITTRTLISNNGAGIGTYDDNTSPIWNTATMKLQSTTLKEVVDVQLRFRLTTDTLGGAFEIEAFDGSAIDIIEEEINIQEQDYTIRFKLVMSTDAIANGVCFFITPELGMAVTITNLSIVFIRG